MSGTNACSDDDWLSMSAEMQDFLNDEFQGCEPSILPSSEMRATPEQFFSTVDLRALGNCDGGISSPHTVISSRDTCSPASTVQTDCLDFDYLDLGDFDLAKATLESEATGKQTPLIKEELRYKIQNKRRKNGLEELQPEYKEHQPEILTPEEENKRLRRRESNKRAAAKCRMKKKLEQNLMDEKMKAMQKENEKLRKQIESLENDKKELEFALRSHIQSCDCRITL